jgi:hypothetical protein
VREAVNALLGKRAVVALAFALLSIPQGFAADNFHKLKDADIRARLAGMEITDGVHWAEQYMRDGTYKAFHMGKPSTGKWYARDGELCLVEGKGEPECKEVWVSGSKVEFRGGTSGCRPWRGFCRNSKNADRRRS